jgi:hemerythrin-like domain-containing protein
MKSFEQPRRGRDPLEILRHQHEEGMRHLLLLENAAESIKASGFSAEAFEQIAESIRWMNTEVRRHTKFEEQYLFPLIDRHMKNVAEQMRGDHRDLWDSFSELLDKVKEVEEGRLHGTSIREVVAIAFSIVEQMRAHIRRENTVLYPAMKQLLTEQESRSLLEGILHAP